MESDSSSRKQAVTIGYIFAAAIGMVLLQWALTTYNTVDTIPYQRVRAAGRQRQRHRGLRRSGHDPGQAEGQAAERKVGLCDRPRRSGARRKAGGERRRRHRRAVGRAVPDPPVVDRARADVLSDLDLPRSPAGGSPGLWRADVDRQVAGQGLCRKGHQGHLRRRGRRR